MRVLFLDIDGVLNNKWSIKRFGTNQRFDELNLAQVNRITAGTGARIVVSSNWREGNPLWRVQACLGQLGVEGPIMDQTPVLKDVSGYESVEMFTLRGIEIHQFLGKNPWVSRYAVLDDNLVTGHDENFFRTDHHDGLTEKLASLVIAHLLA